MPSFPIWDLFDTIGTVEISQTGLYYSYHATVQCQHSGFIRLYLHGGDISQRLGIFCESQGVLQCQGRVSRRSIGTLQEVFFSIHETQWTVYTEPLDGGIVLPEAMSRATDDGRLIIVRDGEELVPELLPFFCFLKSEIIQGLPCLTMVVDKHGRPVVPNWE